ncbi:MBL fold metallo-hydrolase [Burkholderia ubonensis]|uniref:MBL fold metallo-hydrolase n=1 Tax=Burkholderia ubonensis TaxID=101571 RepID=UPI00075A4311|nr:MBL fold metallo-hydrolase [Burkholderia ubonensis]KVO35981.1 MBL fold metallo-hydrolase [Burkholderia ubonensis]
MNISSSTQVYLRQNIQFEPLINGWYAWFHTLPPLTAALNVAERFLPIMKSYAASPMMHVAACNDPAMRGGPFIDLGGQRVDEIRALIAQTTARATRQLELAKAYKAFSTLLLEQAKGMASDPIYAEIPEVLKGYVEIYYDLNHNPSFRVFESLLYASPFYARDAQSIALSAIDENTPRPFILSTPRLKDERTLFSNMAFDEPALDRLFRMRDTPGSYAKIVDLMRVEEKDEPLFRSFFVEEAPEPKPDRSFDGDDIRVRYFGHACLLIQSRGVSILLDPLISYGYDTRLPRYTFADLPDQIDYVLLTHSHHDHIVLETLLQLRHKIKTVVVGRNFDGFPQDPSLELALRKLGFDDVLEVRDAQEIKLPNGAITAIPFLGEHNDLAIQSKQSFMIRFGNRSVLSIADSCNLDPVLYEHVFRLAGKPDTLFVGMETEGAPPSWVYGPLFPKALPRDIDQSRRARGCKIDEAAALVDGFAFNAAYVYAMGQEPWLNHLLDNTFDENSPSHIQSTQFVAHCKAKGIASEVLYATKEIVLCQN